MTREILETGAGPTEKLNLRVSVAALARVLLDDPEDGRPLLVLERTATLQERENGRAAVVRAKPYGGGVRLRDPDALRAVIGDFHFDSVRSRQQADFRILIREADWPQVQAFCLRHLQEKESGPLESSPARELAEEFQDSLKVDLAHEQAWNLAPLEIVIEAHPAPTANPRAPEAPTVRMYSIHEARLRSPKLVAAVLANSVAVSDEQLRQQAREDRRAGGKGRANATLALSLDWLISAYGEIAFEERGVLCEVGGHLLDGNVAAILPGVEVPKYHRLPICPITSVADPPPAGSVRLTDRRRDTGRAR
jgi:hypothetical protein